MPRRDGTGPMGGGTKTGRGAGYCVNATTNKAENSADFGYGFGRGCGLRRMFNVKNGLCLRYNSQISKNTNDLDEKNILKNQATFLESQLDNIKNRLIDLDKNSK